MADAIEFYFDFSSPYAYLASEKIDDIAASFGRKVKWRPILLGVVLKEAGGIALMSTPQKKDYALRDFARSARFLGVPYTHPAGFPLATQIAARAYYWLLDQQAGVPRAAAHAGARAFAHAAFRAFFAEGRDISDAEVVLELAAAQGADRAALAEALSGQPLKDRLKAECAAALEKGVFGSPHFIVDGEPFFGADRLPQVERWLENGGF